MLQPVRTKWRKAHKGRIHGAASRANFINYGAYALKALSPERVTGKLNKLLSKFTSLTNTPSIAGRQIKIRYVHL